MPETTGLLPRLREALNDQYAVERELGRGGMATVFLARDLRHRRDVALKVLNPELSVAIGADRFQREIEIAARLSHPHILPLLNSGSFRLHSAVPGSEIPYYVMPFVEGESIRDRLTRDGRIPVEEAVRFARETADALDYAHRHGVVHRDIKPDNILLSEGHAVVADFGVARAVGMAGGGRLTGTGLAVGSPQYMSPEQIEGRDDIDGRSDLYSLACVLHEMLTGVAPFGGGSPQSVMTRRMTEPPPSLKNSGIHASVTLDSALRRALAIDREARFSTSGEFAGALTGAVVPPASRSFPFRLVAGLAVIALLAGGFLLNRRLSAGGRRPITSLAILPLSLSSSDSTTRYLSEGIHEGVADRLRRLPQLQVTAPSLVTQLQRQRPNATSEELGRTLGVGAVLTWDLRPTRDSLHVRAELLQIPGGSLLWSSRYDRPFRDILAIQTDIARTISESLRITLRGVDTVRLARQPTRDPVAYDLYLKGLSFRTRASVFGGTWARESAESASVYAHRVIDRDPQFVGGHFLLSEYYLVSAFRGWVRPFNAAMDSTTIELGRAFALDSTFAAAWTNRGFIGFYLKDDFPAAKRDLAMGVRLDSGLAHTRRSYSIYIGEFEGQLDSAIHHASQATRLSPEALYLNTLGDLLMRARRYDSALVVLRAAIAADPRGPGPWTRLIQTYERTGRWSEAVEARRGAPDTSGAEAFAAAFNRDGEAGYRRVLEQDIRRRIDSLAAALAGPKNGPADTLPPLREVRIALLYGQLGEWSKAMDWVLREHRRRPRRLAWIVVHPDRAGLRNDSRFLTLVKQEGLEHLIH
jgi:eukaryotic-like serine/threonine-protein kinase